MNTISSKVLKGLPIRYLEVGHGEPVVLLSGLPYTASLWKQALLKRSLSYRYICVDFIGDQGLVAWQRQLQLLTQLLHKLELEPVHLVMHGLGSIIGLNFAATRPELCQSLTFIDPYLGGNSGNNLLFAEQINSCVTANWNQQLVRQIMLQSCLTPSLDIIDECLQDYNNNYAELANLYTTLQAPGGGEIGALVDNAYAKLKASELPKLLFYALPGFMCSIDQVIQAKSHFSNLEVQVIEDCFNLPSFEQLTSIIQQLEVWLAQQFEFSAVTE